MARSEKHEEIMKLMESTASGKSTGSKKLKYDPIKKVFVSADNWDPSADKLIDVTPTDMKSFR